jgi:pyruvate formate lyase activating enzyme
MVVETRCVRCGECGKVCVHGGPTVSADETDQPTCLVCGACVAACPTGARQIVGRNMTVSEVMTEILKDRLFYDESGGGVTFSGGEPLSQFHFLKELLAACHHQEIHTAIDTCGFAPWEQLLALIPLTDLFLYDLKLMDDEQHRCFTGVSNALILRNLLSLAAVHQNLWIRVPIIPGINDTWQQLTTTAHFILNLRNVRQVNLLPYHQTGILKFKRLQQSYKLQQTPACSVEHLEQLVRQFVDLGLPARAVG